MAVPDSPSPEDELRASGPGVDAESLRTAYLDLLKLTLCDLINASTREVRWTGDKRVFWRTLTDQQRLQNRRDGRDWPLDGLSMSGLERLGDLQRCLEAVVRDGVPGDAIEAGAWRGGASILARATLDSLGARERTVWVADSFQGFPAAGETPDRAVEIDLQRIGYLAPALATVRGYFARFGVQHGVRFVPGFFEDTMAGLRGGSWALIRLDGDTYAATTTCLEALYDGLEPGGFVVIDDYFHPYLPDSCRRAVDEFRARRGVEDPLEQVDWNGARWRKSAPAKPSGEPPAAEPFAAEPPAADRAPADAASATAALAPRDDTVPSDRELQLADELAAVRAELEQARRALSAARRSATGRLAGWVRRTRGRR